MLDQAQQTFRSDWAGLHGIAVEDEVDRRVDELLSGIRCAAPTPFHLASALVLRDLAKDHVTFACADVALVNAARAEGWLLRIAP